MKTYPLTLPVLTAAILAAMCDASEAQPAGTNYDETQVPRYQLPDPLVCEDGERVSEASQWARKRRPEVLRAFQKHVYGRSPDAPEALPCESVQEDSKALGGRATRREIQVHFTSDANGPGMRILLYIPNHVAGPVPAFAGLNFQGNHTIHADPGISILPQWTRPKSNEASIQVTPGEETRGAMAARWQVERLMERGYALATVFYGDIEPDFATGWNHGIRAQIPLHSRDSTDTTRAASPSFPSDAGPTAWGAIAAWAWGLSRVLDCLEKMPQIDARKVAVLGHSRLGKTALWAGAQDERFAIVISNDSGCGGAALSRRRFGETVERINSSFPHWFCQNFKSYNGREDKLPVDQHLLIALVAPRPVYVASATEDLWADPRGEFLSAQKAEPVYALLGKEGLKAADLPLPDQPTGVTIGYHLRSGKHDITLYDWERYLDFADRHFKQ